MHLHLNPLGGLAGDMFCAALLDAFPDLFPLVRDAIASVGMPRRAAITLTDSRRPIGGRYFEVLPESEVSEPLCHTPFREIRRLLEEAPLPDRVRARALAVFSLLARAEGRVHRIDPDCVEFHEVGSWDSIADILGASVLLEALDVQSASCGPLPLGGGNIRTAHGFLPVPAPATALLLEGLPVVDDGVPGERVTPTGAAILKSLDPSPIKPGGGILKASGVGYGTRELSGMPNCLQILAIETGPASIHGVTKGIEQDRVLALRFEVDDQTPEDLALALEHLRAAEGVHSVTCFQGIGKAGRPTMSVEMLARPEGFSCLVERCLRETTTIGLRWQLISRVVLRRSEHRTEIGGTELRVKSVDRPGGRTAKAEVSDVAGVEGHDSRERLRRVAAERACDPDPD